MRLDPAQTVQNRSTHHHHHAQDLDLAIEQLSAGQPVCEGLPQSRSRIPLTRISPGRKTAAQVAWGDRCLRRRVFRRFPQPQTRDHRTKCYRNMRTSPAIAGWTIQQTHESSFHGLPAAFHRHCEKCGLRALSSYVVGPWPSAESILASLKGLHAEKIDPWM